MSGQEILRFKRPLRCLGCCIPSCYPDYTQVGIIYIMRFHDTSPLKYIFLIVQLLEIYHQNELLGRVREVPICCFSRKHLEVWDKKDQKIFDISGPCCPVSCGGSVPFPVCYNSKNYFGNTFLFYMKYHIFFLRLRTRLELMLVKFLNNGEDFFLKHLPTLTHLKLNSQIVLLWKLKLF